MKDLFTHFQRNWSLHIGCNIYYSVTPSFFHISSARLSRTGFATDFATDFYLVKIMILKRLTICCALSIRLLIEFF